VEKPSAMACHRSGIQHRCHSHENKQTQRYQLVTGVQILLTKICKIVLDPNHLIHDQTYRGHENCLEILLQVTKTLNPFFSLID
jgi:hypothetical protein